MSSVKWAKAEIDLLRKLYGSMPNEELLAKHFPAKTKQSLKWQVERWRLGQRDEWADTDLELLDTLAKCNVPSAALGRVFNRTPQAIAVKLSQRGIQRSRRARHEDSNEANLRVRRRSLSNFVVGALAELRCTQVLLEKGFEVFRPFQNNHRVDLLAIIEGCPIRIQVKSAIYDFATKRFRLPLTSRRSAATRDGRRNIRSVYDDQTTDFVMAVCPGVDAIYIIPSEVVACSKYANLYPTRIPMALDGQSFEAYRDAFDQLLKPRTRGEIEESALDLPSAGLPPLRSTGRWTEREDLIVTVLNECGCGPQAIARILGRSLSSIQIRQRRLGLEVAGAREVPDYVSHYLSISKRVDRKVIGSATEAFSCALLALHGVNLFVPAVPNLRADAGALVKSRFLRLQIKLASYDAQADAFRVELGTKSLSGVRNRYSSDEVDFFIVSCALQEDLYIIPVALEVESRHLSMFPHRERRSERYAVDLECFRNAYAPLLDEASPGIWRD